MRDHERGPVTTSPEEEARLKEEEEELRLREEQQLQELHAGTEAGLQTAGTSAAATGAVGAEIPMQQATLWGDAWRQLRRNPLFIAAALLLALFTLIALWPGLFTSQDPGDCDILRSVDTPRRGHWFGFDIQGCDYYTRVIHGTDVSLFIGLLVVGVDVVLAMVLGSLAGYYGRWIDAVVARFADIWFAIPTTLGGIVILNTLGNRGFFQVSLVLIVLGWPTLMRLMRSSVLAGKEMDYVQAARALGGSTFRVLTKHILPNGIAPVIV